MITDNVLNYLWSHIPGHRWDEINQTLDRLDNILAVEGYWSGSAGALANDLDALVGGIDEAALRTALGAAADSDLVSLAQTIVRRNQALEAALRACANAGRAASRLLDDG